MSINSATPYSTWLLGLLLIVIGGCDGGNDGNSAPTVTPAPGSTQAPVTTPVPGTSTLSSTPTVSPTVVGLGGGRTGIPAVDAVIDAMLHQDSDALTELLKFEEKPCIQATAVRQPDHCPDGVPVGTGIELLPILACEGTYGTRESILRNYADLVSSGPEIHAVFGAEQVWHAGPADYIVVFSYDRPVADYGVGVVMAADRIVGTYVGCEQTATRIAAALAVAGAPIILGPD